MSTGLTHFRETIVSETTSGTDIVTLQCLSYGEDYKNQDRYIVERWEMPNGIWTLAAVFDGHGSSDAVEFVLQEFPPTLRGSIASAFDQSSDSSLNDSTVSSLLVSAVQEIDSHIRDPFVSLLKSPQNESLVDSDGSLHIDILRAINGTTAMITLIDPLNVVHVASLGDCDAFLCHLSEGNWQTEFLASKHRLGPNSLESERISQEHPDEKCIVITSAGVQRILGVLNISRSLGDMLYKLPSDFSRMVATAVPIAPSLIDLNLTPPYISNIPEVHHCQPPASNKRYLILSSDGLGDLFQLVKDSTEAEDIARKCASAASRAQDKGENMAVAILWEAFGGDRSSNIYQRAVEKQIKGGRIDDITVVVVLL